MTRAALEAWAGAELAAAGLPDPAPVVRGALGRADSPELAATELVCIARSVAALPDPAGYWSRVLPTRQGRALLAGASDEVLCDLAEAHVAPAPDVWDPSWPEHKRRWALLRDDAVVGDRYTVGDGMGSRAEIEVVGREGRPWAVVVDSAGIFPDWWDDLMDRAEALLAAP